MFSDFRFGHLGYWTAILAIAIMAAALLLVNRQVDKLALARENTMALLQSLTELSEAASEAESAHRGWVISRTAGLKSERDRAIVQAYAALDELRSSNVPDVAFVALVGQLESLFEERREVMTRGEQVRGLGEAPAAMRASIAAAAVEVMSRFKSKRDELRGLLVARIAAQREAETAMSRKADEVLAFSGALVLLVLLPTYIGFTRETAARKRVEAQLRDMAENLPGAVFTFRRFRDGHARFEFVSGNVEALRGVTREAALENYRTLLETIHPEDVTYVKQVLDRAATESGHVRFSYRMATDPEKWIQTTAQALAQPDGSVVWHGYWEDITEKRELEQELVRAKERAEAANLAKSHFLAMMSHEIRTPMTGVLGMLEVLATTKLDPEQRGAVAVVRDSGEALLRIIGDILDFSKVEAGKVELIMEPADLRSIIERVANLYRAAATKKNVALELYADPGLHAAYRVDAVRLQQILSNLASNALKFTDSGRIEISAELHHRAECKDVLRFCVRDTGRGISPHDRPRLFSPFAQAGDHNEGGSGLGLAISDRLAQLMGGSLSLESEEGVGTVAAFAVALDRADRPGHSECPTHTQPTDRPERSHDAARVLIVDDHPINRLVLDRQVAMLGYVGDTAGSAREALERLSQRRYAAMLADVNMPEIDGFELTALIRNREKREHLSHLVIIACTANAMRGDDRKCFEAGMDDYVPKPVTRSQLAAVLHKWLGAPPSKIAANDV